MAGYMLEGLYDAAGATTETAEEQPASFSPSLLAAAAGAVEFAHAALTGAGNNSWAAMLAQNATMTMESWTIPPWADSGGGTLSHPWSARWGLVVLCRVITHHPRFTTKRHLHTASPAFLLPRHLVGVRPLADAWRRVALRPLPSRALATVHLSVPTPRGVVALAFAFNATTTTATATAAAAATPSGGSFAVNVTLPGNTVGELCLPRYLFDARAQCSLRIASESTVSGAAAATPVTACAVARGALLCAAADLGPGYHVALLECAALPPDATESAHVL